MSEDAGINPKSNESGDIKSSVVQEVGKPPILALPEKTAASLLKNVGETQDPDLLVRLLDALPVQGNDLSADKSEESGELKTSSLREKEDAYLDKKRDRFKGELDKRYADSSTEVGHITNQVNKHVDDVLKKVVGASPSESLATLSHDGTLAELKDQAFNQETAVIVLAKAQERVKLLFNSEHASKNPEKQRIVSAQTEQFVSLLVAAQADKSMTATSADLMLRLVDENIAKLAYQDRAATENWLGDHGVRHLVEHNIGVSMKLADEMERNGMPLTAGEKVILHQIMIDHDIGYATDAVRNPVNRLEFADGGHNVLAAKYIRQQAEDPESVFSKVFTAGQAAVIHQGILEHDSREVKLTMTDPTPEQRNDNLYSIVHAADNTHAFEDKLPEILYSHPDTLRVMRLMKSAGEIGDEDAIKGLREQLVASIDARTDISSDDKQALKTAVGVISSKSYEKSVPRICGNKPEFKIESGAIHIEVTESAIHQEVMGVFQKDSEQIAKLIDDVAGIKDVDLGTTNSVSSPEGTVVITLRTGEARATEQTDYQRQIDTLISDPAFRNFVIEDNRLSKIQKALENTAKEALEDSEERANYLVQVQKIKDQRSLGLKKFLP